MKYYLILLIELITLNVLSAQNNDSIIENENLLNQISFLKKQNADLKNQLSYMTELSAIGTKNIEKALEALKEKDLKIIRMVEALNKKDSITSLIIEDLDAYKKKNIKLNYVKESNRIPFFKYDNQSIIELPCKINNLQLNFILDTGASDVSISMTEAMFMFKNGYLDKGDIVGTDYYLNANGEINEGTIIILKKIQIADIILYNVRASVVNQIRAPLLLGQSALSRMKKFSINYENSCIEFVE